MASLSDMIARLAGSVDRSCIEAKVPSLIGRHLEELDLEDLKICEVYRVVDERII